MKLNSNSAGVRLVLGAVCALSVGLLSGCISYRSTGAVPAPQPVKVEPATEHASVLRSSARTAELASAGLTGLAPL